MWFTYVLSFATLFLWSYGSKSFPRTIHQLQETPLRLPVNLWSDSVATCSAKNHAIATLGSLLIHSHRRRLKIPALLSPIYRVIYSPALDTFASHNGSLSAEMTHGTEVIFSLALAWHVVFIRHVSCPQSQQAICSIDWDQSAITLIFFLF